MSKITDDIIKQIQDEIKRRGGNIGSLEELNKIAAEINDRHNLTPQPDFEGLSPIQMHMVLHFQPGIIKDILTITEKLR